MNAFEKIVGLILEERGYWIRKSVKVEISEKDKTEIGKFKPRPEIDIVALNMKQNELLLIEVKSFLDSPGVKYNAIFGENERYKLLSDSKFQRIVSNNIKEDYIRKGLVSQKTEIKFALAAGKIKVGDQKKIKEHFDRNKWILIAPEEIREEISKMATKGWEDDEVVMTAKLILRK